MVIERNCADYGETENVWDEQNLYPEFQSGSDEQTVQKKGECKKGGAKAMANEKRLIDANALLEHLENCIGTSNGLISSTCVAIKCYVEQMPTVDSVILPCSVGDTVYGMFGHYGKKIHECKVVKCKVCQFRDRTLHYFLDVEFAIIDPYYRDGRLMRCMQQAVFGEDFGSWDRVYRTFEEAAVAFAKIYGDENG